MVVVRRLGLGYLVFEDVGESGRILARVEARAQIEVQTSLALIEHVDLGNLRSVSI